MYYILISRVLFAVEELYVVPQTPNDRNKIERKKKLKIEKYLNLTTNYRFTRKKKLHLFWESWSEECSGIFKFSLVQQIDYG